MIHFRRRALPRIRNKSKKKRKQPEFEIFLFVLEEETVERRAPVLTSLISGAFHHLLLFISGTSAYILCGPFHKGLCTIQKGLFFLFYLIIALQHREQREMSRNKSPRERVNSPKDTFNAAPTPKTRQRGSNLLSFQFRDAQFNWAPSCSVPASFFFVF